MDMASDLVRNAIVHEEQDSHQLLLGDESSDVIDLTLSVTPVQSSESVSLQTEAARFAEDATLHQLPQVVFGLCDLCYDEVQASRMRECCECRASTCYNCFARWLRGQIQNGHGLELSCHRCTVSITPMQVYAFCGKETFKRHLYYLSKHDNRDNPKAVWCPTEGCWRFLLNEPTIRGNAITCPDCSSELCSLCYSYAHDGEKCAIPHMGLGNRVLFHVRKGFHTKKCPYCGIRIERAGGCTQMICSSCQTRFCWRCRGLLEDLSGNPEKPRLHVCVCARISHSLFLVTIVGGGLLIAPVAIAAAVVVGPPVLIAYATLPKEQRNSKKDKIIAFLERM